MRRAAATVQAKSNPQFAEPAAERVLSRLEHPGDAAAVFLVFAVMHRAEIGPREKTDVVTALTTLFPDDPGAAEGHFSFGRMAVGQLGEVERHFKRLAKPLLREADAETRHGVVIGMGALAGGGGSFEAPWLAAARSALKVRLS